MLKLQANLICNLLDIAHKTQSTNMGFVKEGNARHDRNQKFQLDREYTLYKTKREGLSDKGQKVRNSEAAETMINQWKSWIGFSSSCEFLPVGYIRTSHCMCGRGHWGKAGVTPPPAV